MLSGCIGLSLCWRRSGWTVWRVLRHSRNRRNPDSCWAPRTTSVQRSSVYDDKLRFSAVYDSFADRVGTMWWREFSVFDSLKHCRRAYTARNAGWIQRFFEEVLKKPFCWQANRFSTFIQDWTVLIHLILLWTLSTCGQILCLKFGAIFHTGAGFLWTFS